jgi:hypothetical protein
MAKRSVVILFITVLHLSINTIRLAAQADSVGQPGRHHLSVNMAAGLISGEANVYYDLKLSSKWGAFISYGHRFYSFNMVEDGGGGSGYRFVSQTGDIVRIGLKRYWSFNTSTEPAFYLLGRIGYWNLHTPKYIKRYGSNGLNTTTREVISVDKNVGNIGIGIGKELHFKRHLFIDMFLSAGISCGEKEIHVYSSGASGGSAVNFTYPPNTFRKVIALFPTIELGFKLGGWF